MSPGMIDTPGMRNAPEVLRNQLAATIPWAVRDFARDFPTRAKHIEELNITATPMESHDFQ